MRSWIVVILLIGLLTGAGTGCARVSPMYTITPLEPGQASFVPSLEGNTRAPIVGGNHVRILLNGDELFPALLDAIRHARKSITFSEYTFEESDVSEQVVLALAKRCRAGVRVNLLLDYAGSLRFPREYTKSLETSGCHVAWFRPLKPWQLNRFNHRSHRRIVVVDGRIGFTGGFGFNEKWTGDGVHPDHWRDTHVRVDGPAVEYLQAAFAQNWREATGVVLIGDAYFPLLKPVGDVRAQVVQSSPAGGSHEAYVLFLMVIESARRSIYVTNPYFVPDHRMAQALIAAARRGVDVVALVPGKIDHNLVREASRAGFAPLLEAGIKIFEYQPALLHAKTIVVDGTMASVGSTNLDNRSFALNEELNLMVYDARLARRMEEIFWSDVRHARKVTKDAWEHRGLKAWLLELIASPLKSQL